MGKVGEVGEVRRVSGGFSADVGTGRLGVVDGDEESSLRCSSF